MVCICFAQFDWTEGKDAIGVLYLKITFYLSAEKLKEWHHLFFLMAEIWSPGLEICKENKTVLAKSSF